MVARLVTVLALALATTGCSTMGTLHGARPLEPGEHMMQAAISLQKHTNPVTTALDLPLPQLEFGYRRGLAPDVDWGARVYMFGAVTDLRYRFAALGPFDLATQPSISISTLPTPAPGFGNLDLALPLLAEMDLGAKKKSSLVLSARTVGRQHFAWLEDPTLGGGSAGRFELLAGGGVRLSRRFRRLRIGGYADVLANTSRLGPVWVTGGADLGLVLGNPRERGGGAD